MLFLLGHVYCVERHAGEKHALILQKNVHRHTYTSTTLNWPKCVVCARENKTQSGECLVAMGMLSGR